MSPPIRDDESGSAQDQDVGSQPSCASFAFFRTFFWATVFQFVFENSTLLTYYSHAPWIILFWMLPTMSLRCMYKDTSVNRFVSGMIRHSIVQTVTMVATAIWATYGSGISSNQLRQATLLSLVLQMVAGFAGAVAYSLRFKIYKNEEEDEEEVNETDMLANQEYAMMPLNRGDFKNEYVVLPVKA